MADIGDRLAFALADRYRIERRLGEGGMATVYLAEDLKHRRKVAVKVLRPELAAVLGAERFVQEITTTASLQHPHILPLFDSGQTDGFLYYVMPYVEGETLRNKLDRETQLGNDEAVKIATEVADALDYAHRNGVIHRDIKPENILLHDGRPMVADFGIALAVSAAAGGRMTETGLSLGTPHYMSPEQATAERDLTNRSDIYSLGAVLYEMLAGEPPHLGGSAQQIIMKIVTEDPVPVTKLRRSVPPNVAAAVAMALEKLPADRFSDAARFAAALGDPNFRSTAAAAQVRAPPASDARLWILGAVAMVGVIVALWGWLRPLPTSPPVTTRFDIAIPAGVRLTEAPVLSPDGRRIVYAMDDGSGAALYLRSLDRLEAVRIAGTEGVQQPFFSPDGEWIGFVANRRLHKIALSGGARVTVVDAPSVAYGASWGPMDSIVFTTGQTGLAIVSASGGAVTPIPMSDSLAPRRPQFVGSVDLILLTLLTPSGDRAAVLNRSSNAVRILDVLGEAQDARYVANATGRLVYRQGSRLFTVSVDSKTLDPVGPPVAMPGTHDVEGSEDATGVLSFDVSLHTLVTSQLTNITRDVRRTLFWVDSTGAEMAIAEGFFNSTRLSPDNRYVAFEAGWVYDLRRGSTFRVLDDVSATPVWTPDGQRIVYGGGLDLRWVVNRVGEAAEILLTGTEEAQFPHSFSPDGSVLAFYRIHGDRARDLYMLRMSGDRTPTPYLVTDANERSPEFSPDGRWVAYTSDITGVDEVYVRPYPGPGPATPVSVGGGREPIWGLNSQTIYYRGRDHVMAVPITHQSDEIRFGEPAPLFRDRYDRAFPSTGMRTYDRSVDGRFIMQRSLLNDGATLRVTENWLREVEP